MLPPVNDRGNACPQEHQCERIVRCEIAFPHSSWFLHNAIGPFQPTALHPSRRSTHFACNDVEGSTHPHDEIDAKTILPTIDKVLFFRRGNGDKKQSGSRVTDRLDQSFFVIPEITVMMSRDLQPGISL